MACVQVNNDSSKLTMPTEPGNESIPISQLENLCTCPICFENYNENSKLARMLHCGHTFCTKCILDVKSRDIHNHLTCPTCRSDTTCAVKDISPNYAMMALIRQVDLLDPPSENPVDFDQAGQNTDVGRDLTIDEMIDGFHRELLLDVRERLDDMFQSMKEEIADYSTEEAQEHLITTCENINDAILDVILGPDEDDDVDESESENMNGNSE